MPERDEVLIGWTLEDLEDYRRFRARASQRFGEGNGGLGAAGGASDGPRGRNIQPVKSVAGDADGHRFPGKLLWRTADGVAHEGAEVWLRVSNNLPLAVDEECIGIQQGFHAGKAVFWAIDCTGTAGGSSGCFDFTFCNLDHKIEHARACSDGTVTVLSADGGPDCACTPPDESGDTTPCTETSFTMSLDQLNVQGVEGAGGIQLGTGTVADICAPIRKYCLTGPTLVDVGSGVTCQVWTGSTSVGTATLQKCEQFWCLSWVSADGSGQSFIKCLPVTDETQCGVPPFGDVDFMFGEVPPGVRGTTTIVAENCGPKCWQDNVTGLRICSGADESDTSTEIGGPYADNPTCEAACPNWKCWSFNDSALGDPTFRYCSGTDDAGTATEISGPYVDEAACDDACDVYSCWRKNSSQPDWGTKYCSQDDESLVADFVSGPYADAADCTADCQPDYFCWTEPILGLWSQCATTVPDPGWTQDGGPYDYDDPQCQTCSKWYCVESTAYDGLDCTGSALDSLMSCCQIDTDVLCVNGTAGPCASFSAPGTQSVGTAVLSGPYDTLAECEAACV